MRLTSARLSMGPLGEMVSREMVSREMVSREMVSRELDALEQPPARRALGAGQGPRL